MLPAQHVGDGVGPVTAAPVTAQEAPPGGVAQHPLEAIGIAARGRGQLGDVAGPLQQLRQAQLHEQREDPVVEEPEEPFEDPQ